MRLALSIMIYHFLSGTFPLENYQTLAKKREERLRKIVSRSHFVGESFTCEKLLLSPRCMCIHMYTHPPRILSSQPGDTSN